MKVVRVALTTLWIAALLAGLYRISALTRAEAIANARLLETPPLATLTTPYLNLATLGHRPLWDDLAGIWLLQILVDQKLPQEPAEEVAGVIDSYTRHQPTVESLYMLSCFTLAFDMARPDLCEPITLSGLKALPNSWRIPVTQAFISTHVRQDPRHGALYYGLAASRPGAPAFLRRLTVNLTEKNELSAEELRQSLESLTGSKSDSRFGELLEQMGRPKAETNP